MKCLSFYVVYWEMALDDGNDQNHQLQEKCTEITKPKSQTLCDKSQNKKKQQKSQNVAGDNNVLFTHIG